MALSKIYALDFDGVICDSAIETAITGWQVAKQIWPNMPDETPQEIITLFRIVRPVMETGYEAILIMRALFEGVPAEQLLNNFNSHVTHLIRRDQLNTDKLKQRFGDFRDQWIKSDLDDWIAMNPLFDGLANKLQQLDAQNTYIITTKQERFVSQIFASNNIEFPEERIFGLDRKLSKQQILKSLLTQYPESEILFVEDRLPTLINVIKDGQLGVIKLFFADWGYNTQNDKQAVTNLDTVHSINLKEMMML
jgi:phosphoglycolate phosphatase-like HAD superfamily hydrolase